jgi:hypothetical protein
MLRDVHCIMQDADDLDGAVGRNPVDENMPGGAASPCGKADMESADARTQLFASRASRTFGMTGDRVECAFEQCCV